MALEWQARKDPDDVKDYQLDWSGRLSDLENISSSEWLVPEGVTMESDSFQDRRSTIWLSGGTAGERYRLTNRVRTSEGRTYDQSVILNCQEC